MAVFITGDTHANFNRFVMRNFLEQKELTKDDYVIICGDFGGVWDGSEVENHNLDSLNSRSFTTLFVPGNHENYDMLDILPTTEWNGGRVSYVRDSIIYLHRGQVYDIDGKKFFCFGGASSHDISDGILELDDPDFKSKKKWLDRNNGLYRINHKTWWKRELPTEEEMKEGISNLKKHRNCIDYIITHCAPKQIVDEMTDGTADSDYLMAYLDSIMNMVDYKEWFCGHYHINREIEVDDDRTFNILYMMIKQLI